MVEWTDELPDRWSDIKTNRQLPKAICKFTIGRLTFASSTCLRILAAAKLTALKLLNLNITYQWSMEGQIL